MILNTKLMLVIAAAIIGIAAGVRFYRVQQSARQAKASLQRHEATVKQPPPQKWAASVRNY